MDMQTEKHVIDGVTYTFRQANFMAARTAAMSLLVILKGGIKSADGKPEVDIGAMLENLGSPQIQSVEQFILESLEVKTQAGQIVLLKNMAMANEHFNKHRSHYYMLMFKGVQFHFMDFLPAWAVSKANTKLQEVKAQLDATDQPMSIG